MTICPAPNHRAKKRAILLLVCALSLPVSTPTQAVMDNMFGVMFRMMLVMMNIMSDEMLGNNSTSNFGNNWGNSFGGLNSFNMGMGTLPMMSTFGSPMGMSPWNSFASPMGMSPWNSFGSPMGMSPWNSGGGNPFASGYPGAQGYPYDGGYGYPDNYVASPAYPPATLLEGRWFGDSGEILEVQGNNFQLQTAGARIGGKLSIENNIVNLYSQQTNTMTRYSFLRNQSELLLNSGDGVILTFRTYPGGQSMPVF